MTYGYFYPRGQRRAIPPLFYRHNFFLRFTYNYIDITPATPYTAPMTTKLNFHLPDTLRAEIDDLRHRTGLTLSEIIRQALRMYLASRKAQAK